MRASEDLCPCDVGRGAPAQCILCNRPTCMQCRDVVAWGADEGIKTGVVCCAECDPDDNHKNGRPVAGELLLRLMRERDIHVRISPLGVALYDQGRARAYPTDENELVEAAEQLALELVELGITEADVRQLKRLLELAIRRWGFS